MAYKIEKDKKKHFFVGIPLGFAVHWACVYFFPLQAALSATISVSIIAAGCYGFELFSLITRRGHADNLDAIAGILGGIIGMLISALVQLAT